MHTQQDVRTGLHPPRFNSLELRRGFAFSGRPPRAQVHTPQTKQPQQAAPAPAATNVPAPDKVKTAGSKPAADDGRACPAPTSASGAQAADAPLAAGAVAGAAAGAGGASAPDSVSWERNGTTAAEARGAPHAGALAAAGPAAAVPAAAAPEVVRRTSGYSRGGDLEYADGNPHHAEFSAVKDPTVAMVDVSEDGAPLPLPLAHWGWPAGRTSSSRPAAMAGPVGRQACPGFKRRDGGGALESPSPTVLLSEGPVPHLSRC